MLAGVVLRFVSVIFFSLLIFSVGSENETVSLRNTSASKTNEIRFTATTNAKTTKKVDSDTKASMRIAESTPPPKQKKWITQLFMEAASQFDMDANVSVDCKRDFELYKKHLQNQTVWAVRMLESSQWPSIGVFSGMLDHLGNYDECLWINTDMIRGQYCLAHAIYDYEVDNSFSRQIQGQLDFADETKPAWNALKMYLENPVRVDRHKLTWALCIPSTCKPNDLNISLDRLLSPLFNKYGLNISVNVDPLTCSKKEAPSYTTGYYLVSMLYGLIFALVILSTIYEITMSDHLKNLKNESIMSTVFRCFSLRKNWRQLMKYDKNKDHAIIHLVKIVNIMFIIYGHRYIYFIGFPKHSAETLEQYYKASSLELIHTNVVDVFFMISGFLTFYFGFKPMKKGGLTYLIFNVILRWIRMVPVFIIIVLFIINLLPYMNDAPLWNFRINNEVENCRTSWWTNLLVVSNVIYPDKQCLLISWYISTDIQLTIVGSILLLVICRNRKFGASAAILTFIAGTAATFTAAYINKFYGLLRLYMNLLEDPRNSVEFTKFYVSTYSRLGPYLIGFMSAFFSHVLKERMFVFSVRRTWFFFIASAIIGEGSQYYGCLFYLFGREYNRIESATYAAINRSLFVLPYAVTMCMYFTSGLGKVGAAFQQRFFVPMGRLTYSVFLVNTLLQLFHASSQKSVMPTSTVLNLYWWAAADILFSYFLGLLLHFFAEAPVCNISKMIQRGILKLFMNSHSGSKEVESGVASDTTDERSEGSSEERKSGDIRKNIGNNGCVNHCFDAIDSLDAPELVANETEFSRC